jgi:hypothetical protein
MTGYYNYWLPFFGSMVFQAKIPHDLHVFLNRTNYQFGQQDQVTTGYEFVIGGWNNTQSVIRKGSQGTQLIANKATIANPTRFNTYWVAADASGNLALGTGSTVGRNVLIQYRDTTYTNLAYLSFSCWDVPGVYKPVDLEVAAASTAAMSTDMKESKEEKLEGRVVRRSRMNNYLNKASRLHRHAQ